MQAQGSTVTAFRRIPCDRARSTSRALAAALVLVLELPCRSKAIAEGLPAYLHQALAKDHCLAEVNI